MLLILLIAGWLLVNPFIYKQSVDVLDMKLDYPKAWHHSAVTTGKGDFEGLIITNTTNVRSLQDSPMPGARAEVVITVSPKGNLEEYKNLLISQLSPSSKINSSETQIEGRDAIIISVDGTNTDNFYSKEVAILLDADSGVYKIQGGVLRGVGNIQISYFFSIIEGIIKSLRFKKI